MTRTEPERTVFWRFFTVFFVNSLSTIFLKYSASTLARRPLCSAETRPLGRAFGTGPPGVWMFASCPPTNFRGPYYYCFLYKKLVRILFLLFVSAGVSAGFLRVFLRSLFLRFLRFLRCFCGVSAELLRRIQITCQKLLCRDLFLRTNFR